MNRETLPQSETVLYGRKLGAPAWREELLCTQPRRFDEVKRLAAADGFGHFQVAVIDLRSPPDFGRLASGTAKR